jgi:hypothetical protein
VAAVSSLPTVPGEGRLSEATTRALSTAGRLTTAEGELALVLAARLDAEESTHSQMAALAKVYMAALEAATRGVTGASTALDELRERRAGRRGA